MVKGCEASVSAAVLDGLQADGLQNDTRFLEVFVRSQFGKGHGPQRIRQEIRLKGMNYDGLDAQLAAHDWDVLLEQVHRKRFGDDAPACAKDYAARLRFLSQRGFEPDRINALLRRLRRGDD